MSKSTYNANQILLFMIEITIMLTNSHKHELTQILTTSKVLSH